MQRKSILQTFSTLPVILFLALALSGCQKEDKTLAREVNHWECTFFGEADQRIPIIGKVVSAIKRDSLMLQQLSKALSHTDYKPLWNKAVVKAGRRGGATTTTAGNIPSSDTILLIPLSHAGQLHVSGYIEASITDTVLLGLHFDKQYRHYRYGKLSSDRNNAEKFAIEFMLLDQHVFGQNRFAIKDEQLFRQDANPQQNLSDTHHFLVVDLQHYSGTAISTSNNNDCYEVEIWVDPDGDADPNDNSGNEYFTGETYWVGDCGTDAIGGFGFGFGPTGIGWGDSGGGNPVPDPGAGGSGGSDTGGWLGLGNVGTYQTVSYQLDQFLQPEDSYYFINHGSIDTVQFFSTVSGFKNYLDAINLNTTFSITPDSTATNVNNNKIETAKVILFPLMGIEIDVELQKDSTGLWNLKEVTSDEYGITITFGWEQKRFQQTVTGNEIVIDVTGVLKYNLFLEGIGTVYQQKKTYRLKVSRQSGKITAISAL
jgi:hypothetical protein